MDCLLRVYDVVTKCAENQVACTRRSWSMASVIERTHWRSASPPPHTSVVRGRSRLVASLAAESPELRVVRAGNDESSHGRGVRRAQAVSPAIHLLTLRAAVAGDLRPSTSIG